MKPTIRVLHIDDNYYTRLLVKETLQNDQNTYEIYQVESLKVLNSLISKTYDVILSNFDIFGFADLSIIKYIKESKPDVPIIILTGKGSEEIAVRAMKSGADDYVIKSASQMASLEAAISLVLERRQVKAEHSNIKIALGEREALFRTIFENAAIGVCTVSPEGKFMRVNSTFCQIVGYSSEELTCASVLDFTHPDDKELLFSFNSQLSEGMTPNANYEKRYIHKSGRIVWVNVSAGIVRIPNSNNFYFVCYIQDITAKKQAEANVSQERILLRTLIDSLPDTIYVKDLSGRKLIANTADLIAMNCQSETEALGKTDIEIFKDESGKRGFEEDLNVLRSGNPMLNHEECYTDYEGKKRWRLTSKIPLYNNQKQIIGLVGFGHDITEQKQAEELLTREQHLMHALMDNIPDGIYFKDLNSRFLRVNKAMAHLFGLSDSNMAVGKTDYDFFKTDHSQQTFIDEQEIISTGKPILCKEEMETWFDRPPTWVLSTKMPLIDQQGNIIGTFGISRNITERKLAEAELVKAKEKAEESDRLKTAFLHNISHEIRTPMNAIVGFSEYLNNPDLSIDKREYYTDIIIRSSNQLLSIITDIVNIATIEAGQEKVHETEINLNSLLRLLYDQYLLKAQKQNIFLSFRLGLDDSAAIIVTDETKLTEIISNLLGNAIKFTKNGYVDFGYKQCGALLEFYVKDTGIGIPKEMHTEIFERFRQVETSSNRRFGGSGLGLSISKAYAEMLGGNIWVNSEPGRGSEFSFTIEYKRAVGYEIADIPISGELNKAFEKSQTILIAEDEDLNFMLLQELLSTLGVQIVRARNGREAVEICMSNIPIHLILMDIKMPGMDGYEAARRIKELRPAITIIAQTAYNIETDKARALASGCSDFISKPFRHETLLTKVKEVMMNSGSMQ
ncbi:MAG TPA: PAS domain S-box protein [Bacteroidales bacterium]|nr:PAS domain S-box protein [Bacteroidales bacterium]